MSKLFTTANEFEKYIKESDRVAVLFYASWCPYSRKFLPIFEKHSTKNENCFCKTVVDEAESLCSTYSIEVYPTVLLFEKGKVAKRLDGILGEGLNEKQLVEFIGTCGI